MNCNSIKFFLDKFITQVWGLSESDWVVTSLGSGIGDKGSYWSIWIKNDKTREEKQIRIPCYKD
nr:MAG TPA: hypothetical protein [Caudoviricetes sp.]